MFFFLPCHCSISFPRQLKIRWCVLSLWEPLSGITELWLKFHCMCLHLNNSHVPLSYFPIHISWTRSGRSLKLNCHGNQRWVFLLQTLPFPSFLSSYLAPLCLKLAFVGHTWRNSFIPDKSQESENNTGWQSIEFVLQQWVTWQRAVQLYLEKKKWQT